MKWKVILAKIRKTNSPHSSLEDSNESDSSGLGYTYETWEEKSDYDASA